MKIKENFRFQSAYKPQCMCENEKSNDDDEHALLFSKNYCMYMITIHPVCTDSLSY